MAKLETEQAMEQEKERISSTKKIFSLMNPFRDPQVR